MILERVDTSLRELLGELSKINTAHNVDKNSIHYFQNPFAELNFVITWCLDCIGCMTVYN